METRFLKELAFTPPKIHDREIDRIKALRDLNILDTDPEERFDRYTRIGKSLLNCKYCLISLVDTDRQWFKSQYGGIGCSETSRGISFCGHTINEKTSRYLLIKDTLQDPRFKGNPLVTEDPNIRFYLGIIIRSPKNGLPLGTLCAIDDAPRDPSEDQINALIDLANCVEQDLGSSQDASTDPLTGLSNRRLFYSLSSRLCRLASDYCFQLTALYLDINKLKYVNVTFGHDVGDKYICGFASALARSIRSGSHCDLVARLSGDEFGILILANNPESTTRRIFSRLEEYLDLESDKLKATTKHPIDIRCSAGFASMLPEIDGNSELLISSLMTDAENRMRLVKQVTSSPKQHAESNSEIKSGNYVFFLESNFTKQDD